MRIVHISLSGPYTDNWSYQDNILPRVQRRQGNDVTVIAPCLKHENTDQIVDTPPGDYVLKDGVRVIRLPLNRDGFIGKVNNLLRPYKVYTWLEELSPNIIMLHGLGFGESNRQVARYIRKHPKCILVGDTHMYNRLATKPQNFKHRLIQEYYQSVRKLLYPYYKKLFGITPACVSFAVNEYGVSREKIDLLPLGYDPALCPWEDRKRIRSEFREKHGIAEDEILIVHGGKIIPRRKTPETIQAVQMLNNPKVKLMIFGAIAEEMKPQVEPLLEQYSDSVIYLGRVDPKVYNEAYLAADLALFPGGQSVVWQEAIGCGVPIAVGNDEFLDYLNQGGNAAFIDDTTPAGIHAVLAEILQEENLKHMKKAAEGEAREFFSYERIAKLVTDCVD